MTWCVDFEIKYCSILATFPHVQRKLRNDIGEESRNPIQARNNHDRRFSWIPVRLVANEQVIARRGGLLVVVLCLCSKAAAMARGMRQ